MSARTSGGAVAGLLDPAERRLAARDLLGQERGRSRGRPGRGSSAAARRSGRARAPEASRRRGPGPRTRAATPRAGGSSRGRPGPPPAPRPSGRTRPGVGRRGDRARAPADLSRYGGGDARPREHGPRRGVADVGQGEEGRLAEALVRAVREREDLLHRLAAAGLAERTGRAPGGRPGAPCPGSPGGALSSRPRPADGETSAAAAGPARPLVDEVLLQGPDRLLPPDELDLREEERGDRARPSRVQEVEESPGEEGPLGLRPRARDVDGEAVHREPRAGSSPFPGGSTRAQTSATAAGPSFEDLGAEGVLLRRRLRREAARGSDETRTASPRRGEASAEKSGPHGEGEGEERRREGFHRCSPGSLGPAAPREISRQAQPHGLVDEAVGLLVADEALLLRVEAERPAELDGDLARLTSVQERWPFLSLRANRRRVRTDSAKSATWGSGSGSAATFSSKCGMSDSEAPEDLPLRALEERRVLVAVLPVEDDRAAVGVLHLDPPPGAAGVGVLLRAVGPDLDRARVVLAEDVLDGVEVVHAHVPEPAAVVVPVAAEGAVDAVGVVGLEGRGAEPEVVVELGRARAAGAGSSGPSSRTSSRSPWRRRPWP